MSSEEPNNWGLKVYMPKPKPTSHDTGGPTAIEVERRGLLRDLRDAISDAVQVGEWHRSADNKIDNALERLLTSYTRPDAMTATAEAKVRAAERAADFADKRTEAHRLEIRRLTDKVAALQEDLVDLLTERKDLRTQLGLSAVREKAARGEIIDLMIDGLQALGIDCSDDPTTDHDPILFVARHLRQLGTDAPKKAPESAPAPADARGRASDKVEITRGRLAALEAIEEWAAGALRREAVIAHARRDDGSGPSEPVDGYVLEQNGRYFCDDKHSDRTWWGPLADPFLCVFDTPDDARKHAQDGDVVHLIDRNAPCGTPVPGGTSEPDAAEHAALLMAWMTKEG